MSNMSAPIDIFRAAMPLIGGRVPSSLDDQTDEAMVFTSLYEPTVCDELTKHAWLFAEKRATLVYQGETGDAPTYAYTLPADILTIRRVLLALSPFTTYDLRGGKLLCDVSETTDLDAIYTWRVDEPDWPADFAMGVVYRMASHMLRGLLDRAGQADSMSERADESFKKAMAREKRSAGPVNPYKNRLAGVWGGGAGPRSRFNASS